MTDSVFATTALLSDDASDYGDFGEDAEELAILDDLLAQPASDRPGLLATEPATVSGINHIDDIEDYESPRRLLLPVKSHLHRLPDLQVGKTHDTSESEVLHHPKVTSDKNRRRSSAENSPSLAATTVAADAPPDPRSPLDRFRKPPNKTLSVSDLISPAWCELQYFYVLSKHGRRKRTSAMKAGSAVHKELEDKIHVTVPVETTTKEDGFGLRIWNICQGLQTLQEIGQTRELEVWGVIGGEVVNGVIDEVTYTCPTPDHGGSADDGGGRALSEVPEYQTSITEYLLQQPTRTGAAQGNTGYDEDDSSDERQIYITDVKTRVTPTLPTGSSIRPTILQLHLYHHMLENMAQNNLPLSRLAERYGLDVNQPFSDSFLAQVGQLNQEILLDEQPQSRPGDLPNTQDSLDLILQHNNLASLWEYMQALFRRAFLLPQQSTTDTEGSINSNSNATHPTDPSISSQLSVSDLPNPSSNPTRLSPLLTATYMTSAYRHHSRSTPSRILGHKSFTFSPTLLKQYLSDTLSWWRGDRGARGVDLAEAWKCRSCDFRSECEWIMEKNREIFERAAERRRMRAVAGMNRDEEGGSQEKEKLTTMEGEAEGERAGGVEIEIERSRSVV